jgi:hypothetical protein
MTEVNTQKENLSQKINHLQQQLAYMEGDDARVVANTVRRLQHKLNELNGVENSCDIQDDFCLSCGA